MHKLDLVMDFQFGSTGKGLIAGYLAKRGGYDSVACSFATNAGHTYIDRSRGIMMMTQQLPTGISSPTVKNVFLGPGALISPRVLREELDKYGHMMVNKRLLIHPHAAIVQDYHMRAEVEGGMSRMGSTTKGVGEAMIERIRRQPNANIAFWHLAPTRDEYDLFQYVVTTEEYDYEMSKSEAMLVEGAQGFSLSMYHGFYPFTTSRDVTPWQIAADCGIPFKWASYIQVVGTLRTLPIRVNNRDGSSGPGYPDQFEHDWSELGLTPELTTVTKLPRRLFSFSHMQLHHAMQHCGGYYNTRVFLNFANYIETVAPLVKAIETPQGTMLNPPKVEWIGVGPDDSEVIDRATWDNSDNGID
jgi:adenylosuccinate synthase